MESDAWTEFSPSKGEKTRRIVSNESSRCWKIGRRLKKTIFGNFGLKKLHLTQ